MPHGAQRELYTHADLTFPSSHTTQHLPHIQTHVKQDFIYWVSPNFQCVCDYFPSTKKIF